MTIGPRTTRLLAATGGVALAIALAIALAAPAQAETTSFDDGADTTASLQDILTVSVNHRADTATVKITFTDLRRNSQGGPSSIGIFLDTNQDRTGPEFRLGSGLQNGTDYQLVRMRNWRPVGEPKSCQHHVDLQVRQGPAGLHGRPQLHRDAGHAAGRREDDRPVRRVAPGPRLDEGSAALDGHGRQQLTGPMTGQ